MKRACDGKKNATSTEGRRGPPAFFGRQNFTCTQYTEGRRQVGKQRAFFLNEETNRQVIRQASMFAASHLCNQPYLYNIGTRKKHNFL